MWNLKKNEWTFCIRLHLHLVVSCTLNVFLPMHDFAYLENIGLLRLEVQLPNVNTFNLIGFTPTAQSQIFFPVQMFLQLASYHNHIKTIHPSLESPKERRSPKDGLVGSHMMQVGSPIASLSTPAPIIHLDIWVLQSARTPILRAIAMVTSPQSSSTAHCHPIPEVDHEMEDGK